MVKVIVHGALGRMGKEVTRFVTESDDMAACALVDIGGDGKDVLTSLSDYTGEADVIIDFSHHTAVPAVLEYAKARKLPAIIATTGCTDEENAAIKEASELVPVFASGNMSIGVAVLAALAAEAARVMKDADIEIVETHHAHKVDSPSGTASMLLAAVKKGRNDLDTVTYGRASKTGARTCHEIGMHSIRGGGVVGEHRVAFLGADEIIEIKHTALTRTVFAQGALAAARKLIALPPALYSMQDIL